MKNYWLDEIEINTAASVISNSLKLEFEGKQIDMDSWGAWTLDLIRHIDNQRIRDALMWKYTFKYELNEQKCVQILEFAKLPWLI